MKAVALALLLALAACGDPEPANTIECPDCPADIDEPAYSDVPSE